MGDEESTRKVPNQYKQSLRHAVAPAQGRAGKIRSALSKAGTAMTAGAWVSTMGDAFGAELAGRHSTMQRVADNEEDAIQAEISAQPDTVDEHAWQASWNRISSHGGMVPR